MTEFDKYSDLMNLIGYGLAKFDMDFVKEFGFKTRSAFYQYCVDLGFAKTIKSVTNRQDSFDPYFDNGRKGWYQRNQREHIKLFIDSLFGNEDAAGYVGIVKLYIQDTGKKIEIPQLAVPPAIKSRFKQLQETGKEAEFYFMTNYKNIPTFENALLEDARLWGDGYDFQIKLNSKYFLAEVKGVRKQSGAIRLTQSEFEKALEFKQDYFLVVVSNLISSPKFSCISNPLQNLDFTSKEIKSVQLNYHTSALNWSKI
ncbi:MAG: DUF3883 domain-containing protein [Treponema sp.]|nr:DUF3883 domain-containing protein [Treponema sp.]